MFKKLKSAGINTLVLVLSIVIFVVAFMAMNGLAAAQKPATTIILAAARTLNIGDVITSHDITEKTVYLDDNTDLYIPADQTDSIIGGTVALLVGKGQPFFRNVVLSEAGEAYRISAILAKYPDYSLFPLPLDSMNVIAPEITSYLPGDIIGITIVIGSRPQPPEKEETPEAYMMGFPAPATPEPQPIIPGLAGDTIPDDEQRMNAEERAYPPMAKDLFPGGVQVISIQGLPPEVSSADPDSDPQPSTYDPTSQREMLILLVPNKSKEILSLAIQQGDQIIISLLARGDDYVTPGFTYWDFEELFKLDREEVLGVDAP
ncbi:MAG: flagella basal body P-ring formation protein FlgA [Chloroflexi bacterium]|nr:flagella basal body P-ring formation protein FlgA [Chloroflexota bacterium]